MNNLSRRSLLSRAAVGFTSIGVFSAALSTSEGQFVWKASEWKLAEFRKLLNDPARIKQVYDVVQIGDGRFLNNIKNSFNGLQFGFGVADGQVKIAAALHGPANMLNYDDYVWEKYQIGKWRKVTDRANGKPAVKNLFYNSKSGLKQKSVSTSPDDLDSVYQDTSMQGLQSRGAQFLSCHTALEEQVRALISRRNLSQSPEDVVKDMLAHTLAGVLVVASMVAAIALLQAEGHYTYITV
ncbi:MAG: hypothetical protein DMG79_05395 [Acidobacteria bacterium]|nr:MAG: hypothetical protein DMG79_05395 [Acidobacteriota bacterium]